jgi:uncharacterized protein YjbI with pentapeptide repeats
MNMKIVSRHDRTKVLFESATAKTTRELVEEAVSVNASLNDAELYGALLSDANLEGAWLSGADLTGAQLTCANLREASLSGTTFVGAKLLETNLARTDLTHANLAHADLYSANLQDANLTSARLTCADLTYADLSRADLGSVCLVGAILTEADLTDTDLGGADLTYADLGGARNAPPPVTPERSAARRAQCAQRYRERHPNVPVIENLDTHILCALRAPGCSLDMSSWHGDDATCSTTHCRAGWAIALAGLTGHALELQHGPEIAGRMIYLASTGRVPDFFADEETAMKDIERCAAEETETE